MPNNESPIRLRRPKPSTLAFCLAVVGAEILAAVMKEAHPDDPKNPAFALAVILCLVGFVSCWERPALGDRDGAKSGLAAGLVATAGLVVWLEWGAAGLFGVLGALMVIGWPLGLLAERRRMREDEAERAASPVFPDRTRAAVFRRLAPRILATAAARAERGITGVERGRPAGHPGPRPRPRGPRPGRRPRVRRDVHPVRVRPRASRPARTAAVPGAAGGPGGRDDALRLPGCRGAQGSGRAEETTVMEFQAIIFVVNASEYWHS